MWLDYYNNVFRLNNNAFYNKNQKFNKYQLKLKLC